MKKLFWFPSLFNKFINHHQLFKKISIEVLSKIRGGLQEIEKTRNPRRLGSRKNMHNKGIAKITEIKTIANLKIILTAKEEEINAIIDVEHKIFSQKTLESPLTFIYLLSIY